VNATDRWKKVIPERAGDIIDADDLDPASAEFLSPEARPEQLIHDLAEAKQWPDAIKVMTRALPVREALWWACVCARQMETLPGDEAETAALVAAEKWVFKPNDDNRRAAFEVAQDNTSRSAGTLAAFGVALSGGGLPAFEDEYIEVDGAAFAQIVDAAVMVAATEKKGEELHQQFALFLKCGEDIACGGNGKVEGLKG